MDLINRLFALSDKTYADFQAKLTPNIDKDKFIGVRVPVLRAFAKKYISDEESNRFLSILPHFYYDENMLHALLISEMKDICRIYDLLDEFLPYVDNWAVCDIMSPKALKKDKKLLLEKIEQWVKSDKTYTIRFAIEMLMTFYLDDDFNKKILQIPLSVKSDEYYVNMMIAWFYATALAKQWDSTIYVFENKLLDKWTHNKTIQKAVESYRITDDQKDYLRKLRIE